MSEKEAKADADAGQKLDKMLSMLDAVCGRMDALEAADKARKDAEEAEKKEREDKARKDAEEAETEAKRVAADKSRKDGEESEEDKKAREDKARKDAEEAEAKKKAEEEEKADRARKDSEAMQARIRDLEARLPKARSDADYGAMADAQAKADEAYQAFGDSAPPAMNGESLVDYQRRLATGLKKHSAKWKEVDLYALPDSVADIARTDIFADAAAAALLPPEDLAAGQFFEVRKRNPLTGTNIIEFRGKGTFIGASKRPAMRVSRIEARKAN